MSNAQDLKLTNQEGGKLNDSEKKFCEQEGNKFRKRGGRGAKRFDKRPKQANKDAKTNRGSYNDPEWYYISELSGKAVGSIPYNIFPGQFIDIGLDSDITNTSKNSIPGVIAVRYSSAPGKSTSAASAVNIMSKALYTFVRHQNSGHSNYESVDLTLYVLAMDEIYTRYFEAMRIYQVAMTYDLANRNIPDVLLKALKIDGDNIRANLAQFRYGLNIIAAKISSMAVPNNFHLFKRHSIISRAILMDSSSMRGQFYLWTQLYTHKYNPKHEGGGALEAVAIDDNRTYNQILNELEELVNPVISDEDMNIMSGDILKAYGRENLYVLPAVEEYSTATFVYDENMLAQIENSCGERPTGNLDITQENNLIVYNPSFSFSGVADKRIFNSHKDEPDWKDTLEWSRGMTVNGYFGTELIHFYSLVTREYSNDGTTSTVAVHDFQSFFSPNDEEGLYIEGLLAAFDWHPILYRCVKADNAVTEYQGYFGDIKKFTLLSSPEIARLHDSAVMGELNHQLIKASV